LAEFRTLDFTKIRHLVKQPIIIDTKNLLDSSRLRAMGFQSWAWTVVALVAPARSAIPPQLL